MDKKRFNELDVFRGIAALAVVLYHYFYRYEQLYQHQAIPVQWSRQGLYGVHFFFLISGFVIFWSLQRSPGIKAFLLSRFSRIFPAYWAALLITFLVVLVFGLPGREFSFMVLLGNLSMIQEYLNIPHIDQAYWTLTAELTFYFWITLLFSTGRLHHAEYWFLPFMFIGSLYYLEIWQAPLRVNKFLLMKHANLFASGIVFYRIYTGTHSIHAWWVLALAVLANFAIYPWYDAVLLAGFFLVFYLAVSGRLQFLCVRPLLWLGGISFTMYLLHQNIGYVVIREVYALGGSGWLGIAAALVVLLILAELLSRLVERPAARWLRSHNMFAGKAGRAPEAASIKVPEPNRPEANN